MRSDRAVAFVLAMCAVAPRAGAAEERPVAVDWDGVQRLAAGTLRWDAEGRGHIDVLLSQAAGKCSGMIAPTRPEAATASWALACANGLVASGTFAGRDGAGGGAGKDAAGRAVSFVVGAASPAPAAQAAQATPKAAPTARPAAKPAAKPANPSDMTAEQLNTAELARIRAGRNRLEYTAAPPMPVAAASPTPAQGAGAAPAGPNVPRAAPGGGEAAPVLGGIAEPSPVGPIDTWLGLLSGRLWRPSNLPPASPQPEPASASAQPAAQGESKPAATTAAPAAARPAGPPWDGCYAGRLVIDRGPARDAFGRIDGGKFAVDLPTSSHGMKESVYGDLNGHIDAAGNVTAGGQLDQAVVAVSGAMAADANAAVSRGKGTWRKLFTTEERPVTFELRRVSPVVADERFVRDWQARSGAYAAFAEGICKAVSGPLSFTCTRERIKAGDRLC